MTTVLTLPAPTKPRKPPKNAKLCLGCHTFKAGTKFSKSFVSCADCRSARRLELLGAGLCEKHPFAKVAGDTLSCLLCIALDKLEKSSKRKTNAISKASPAKKHWCANENCRAGFASSKDNLVLPFSKSHEAIERAGIPKYFRALVTEEDSLCVSCSPPAPAQQENGKEMIHNDSELANRCLDCMENRDSLGVRYPTYKPCPNHKRSFAREAYEMNWPTWTADWPLPEPQPVQAPPPLPFIETKLYLPYMQVLREDQDPFIGKTKGSRERERHQYGQILWEHNAEWEYLPLNDLGMCFVSEAKNQLKPWRPHYTLSGKPKEREEYGGLQTCQFDRTSDFVRRNGAGEVLRGRKTAEYFRPYRIHEHSGTNEHANDPQDLDYMLQGVSAMTFRKRHEFLFGTEMWNLVQHFRIFGATQLRPPWYFIKCRDLQPKLPALVNWCPHHVYHAQKNVNCTICSPELLDADATSYAPKYEVDYWKDLADEEIERQRAGCIICGVRGVREIAEGNELCPFCAANTFLSPQAIVTDKPKLDVEEIKNILNYVDGRYPRWRVAGTEDSKRAHLILNRISIYAVHGPRAVSEVEGITPSGVRKYISRLGAKVRTKNFVDELFEWLGEEVASRVLKQSLENA